MRTLRWASTRVRAWFEALLVIPAQVAREEAELFTVFSYCAAGDLDAFFLQSRHDFLIAERGPFVFTGDEIGEHFLDAGIRDRGAAVRLVAGREEIFEIENPMGGFDIFIGDGATDRGFVDADNIRDLSHRERLEL